MTTLATILRRLVGKTQSVAPPADRPSALENEHQDAYRKLRVGFTAAVSHELRTPLARLLALLDSVDLPQSDPRAVVDSAREEVEQMRRLVDDLLFLSEIEAGGATDASYTTTVLPVLERVVAARAEEARHAGVAFVVVAAPDAQVPIGALLLRTIIENLVENVLRHARGATRCWLAARREGGRVLVSVVDNGAGVSDADLATIFERFHRGDESRASRGSGLGLSIVKHIVAAAGGEVLAAHGPGRVGLEIRCSFTTL